jgi:hypothetical protein
MAIDVLKMMKEPKKHNALAVRANWAVRQIQQSKK